MQRTSKRPRRYTIAIALASFLSMAPPVVTAGKIQTGTSIRLADGDVQGVVDGKTRKFLGIPFAAPPVGPLRWRPPQPVTPWQTPIQATAFSAACPQLGSVQGPGST